jgi:hypothetical protein
MHRNPIAYQHNHHTRPTNMAILLETWTSMEIKMTYFHLSSLGGRCRSGGWHSNFRDIKSLLIQNEEVVSSLVFHPCDGVETMGVPHTFSSAIKSAVSTKVNLEISSTILEICGLEVAGEE